jgi:hypothetical protein
MGLLKDHIKKNPKRESTLHKVGGYDKNCATGFQTKGWCQIHHILSLTCIASRKEGYPDDMEEYLEACLWSTPWDVNAEPNLIGLPLNKQYRRSDGKTPNKLPSHQVDHTGRQGYTKEVAGYLKENVWNSLTAKKKVHDVDIKTLTGALKDGSDEFRERLVDIYGIRHGGTRVCWENRFAASYEFKWYHPFSMIMNPSHRSPGAPTKSMKGVFKKLT